MDATRELLLRWHGGDQQAMADLVQQEQAFVAEQVRRRLGPLLRRQHDTQDIVQQTMLHALRSAPRFLLSDRGHLRSLLVRMVENTLRSAASHQQRAKRDVRRERSMPAGDSGTVLDLDAAANVTDPGASAAREDLRAWVRLALELLDVDDREVIERRDYHEESFAVIAEQCGEAEDTVRMRYRRALPKLAAAMTKLRQGRLADLL
ncbi:MAG: sigma-70 family RNA polymerase sigma factor [Planctomycetes bacterium]|nr:sigma-70 family RNA polymerase sigma factor [Planctomycetota bacterium]